MIVASAWERRRWRERWRSVCGRKECVSIEKNKALINKSTVQHSTVVKYQR